MESYAGALGLGLRFHQHRNTFQNEALAKCKSNWWAVAPGGVGSGLVLLSEGNDGNARRGRQGTQLMSL